ncbi:hypothetical protein LXA43DRAFT_558254 [Ganoderma leucocontextum]|nr:hypothetical protein LXA43DRAFT_558254 [Ganoderma leucocontextum]
MWWPSVSDSIAPGGTLGALLLSTLIAGILYGVTTLQTVQCVDRFYKDSSILKFLVIVLWLLETLTMIFEACSLYTYSVSYSGTLFALVPIPWSFQIERALSYAVVYGVQMFYVERIRQLGRRYWYLPTAIGLLATGAIGTGLAATVEGSKYNLNLNGSLPRAINVLSTTSAGLGIGTDVLIAGSLYWLCHNRSGSMQKRNLIKHILIMGVNRGVLSALLQIMTMLTYFACRPRLVWIAFHMANSKVHMMSLLSVLNARSSQDGVGHDPEIVDARLRYRIERELDGEFHSRLDTPPMIPHISHGGRLASSQSSWFAKSNEGLARYAPSSHARSTTAVDGQSGSDRN